MRDETMPESQEGGATSAIAENMQEELHKKGAVLTKAWADLFSYLTKYQAELTVKENTMEIAEKEISTRKRQLDDMKPVAPDSEEFAKLQDEIHAKERQLTKAQSELTTKEQLLRRTQSDLTSNMEQLERSRTDVLDKQSEMIRYRGDVDRLKSQLAIQQEQVTIKDNLLKKLQSQLMKENDELKEQSQLDRRALELERRSHELTKRVLREKEKPFSHSSSDPVIEIPDSPPTLDLSVETADFGLSNVISMTESQNRLSGLEHSMSRVSQSSGTDNALSRLASSALSNMQDFQSRLSGMSTTSQSQESSHWRTTPPHMSPSQSKFGASLSQTHASNLPLDTAAMVSSAASDTFFPLSVDEDSKGAIDTSAMMTVDSDVPSGPVPISGPIPSTPGTSESGPMPMLGVQTGAGIEGGGDGKLTMVLSQASWSTGPVQFKIADVRSKSSDVIAPKSEKCQLCRKEVPDLDKHMELHKRYRCFHCGKCFLQKSDCSRHVVVTHSHTKAKPFACQVCGKTYKRQAMRAMHFRQCHGLDPSMSKKPRGPNFRLKTE